MPIVFVHGVNTRKDADYDKAVSDRDALFKGVLLPAAGRPDTDVWNPYWGDDGAAFAFDLGCVPTGLENAVRLGPAGEASFTYLAAAVTASVPETPREDALVLTLARHNFVAALDVLYTAAARSADQEGESELGVFAAQIAQYALAHEAASPDWLTTLDNDDELIAQLQQHIGRPPGAGEPSVELGFGSTVWNWVSEGAEHVGREAGAFLGKPAWNAMRELVVPTVPRFLGDIFVYLKARGEETTPGPIVSTVISDLREAAKKSTASDPLIVIGHSLGGVIAYDILSGFASDVSVDLLCTVGSQVALFEEMKAYSSSDSTITAASGRKVDKPADISRWINVFDYNDILSYKLDPVFTVAPPNVNDWDYPTGNLLHAHGAYFGQPSFYRRLGVRIGEVLPP